MLDRTTGVDGPDEASFALAAPTVQLGALECASLIHLSGMCEPDDPPFVGEGVRPRNTAVRRTFQMSQRGRTCDTRDVR
jgi:hypothetical protein